MIFVCIQPDEKYFIWQLKIQLYNFKRLGIDLSKVHQIFVSQRPMSVDFIKYKEEHPEINIHFYTDTRTSKGYIPSLRPNGFKQFFKEFPEFENEVIFYHDADILFRSLPDFSKFCKDDNTWYVSDTNSYLNADYVKSKGDTILDEMCAIIGVDKNLVEGINQDSGGAQYVLKGTDYNFWHKVEGDCEKLYEYMNTTIPVWASKFANKNKVDPNTYHPIQSWVSDMFCVLWGGLILGKKIKVAEDLAFSWATDAIEVYNIRHIYHNAGVTDGERGRLFYKGDYIHLCPFGNNFSYVDPKSASSMYIKEMNDYLESNDN